MKSLLLLLLIPLSLLSFKANATHVMGAEFEWEALGKDTFLIKVRVYRDCNGVALSSGPIRVTTSCGSTSITTKMSKIGDVTPMCSSVKNRCQSSSSTFSYGIELYELSAVYIATSDIKNGCCEATLSWAQCCRSKSITTGAANQNFYVDAALNSCAGASSPKWSTSAIGIGCLGRDQIIDNSVISKDSLVYTCAEPLQTATTKTSWSSSYSACEPVYYLGFPRRTRSFPSGFHLDSATGELMFRPMKEQQTVICTRVEIYRNGKRIGYMKRDIQYIVIKCPNNNPPVLSGINAKSPIPQNFTTTVCAGKKTCFTVLSSDKDKDDTVKLQQNGGIPGATFTITNPGSKRETGEFCWTPSTSDISRFPHKVVISAKDDACPAPGTTVRSYSIVVQKPYAFDLDMNVSAGDCGTYYLTVKDKNGRSMNDIKWYENDSIYIGSGDSVAHTFMSTGNRKVSVKVDDCLDQSADTTISVATVSRIQLDLADAVVCQNEKLLMKPTVSGQSGALKYDWNIAPSLGYTGHTNRSSVELGFNNASTTSYPVILTVKDSLGCTDADTAEIISKKNTFVDLERDQKICQGDATQINLKQLSGQGNWTGRNVSSNTMDLTGLAPGIYQLQFKFEDTFYCVSDSAQIFLRALPTISISSDFSNCTNSNETVQLSQNPGGGQWTGKGVSGTIFDPAVAGKGTHYLNYLYTDSFGCSNSDSLLATVFDYVPSITVTDSIKACNNEGLVTISAQPSGGGWLGPGIASTSSTIQVDPSLLTGGDYSYIYGYADSNSCTNSDSTILRVAQAPVAGFNVVDTVSISGDSVLVKNQSTGNNNNEYTWKIGNPAFITSQNFNFHQQIDSADTFDVMLISKDPKTGCIDSTVLEDGIVILLNTSSPHIIAGLEIYPNPSAGILNIRTNSSKTTRVTIVNMAGQKTYETTKQMKDIAIDISDLESGIYLLEISQNDLIHSQLLIKK